MSATTFSDRIAAGSARALGRMFGLYHRVDVAPPRRELFLPYATTKRFGFSHFNVVIPDLPAPHRHLACAVLLGRPGAAVFDNDFLPGSPRDTATVSIGTAATGSEGFRVYSMPQDCDLREDGSRVRFGDELVITGGFPDFAVTIRSGELSIDITIACTDQPSVFVRSPVYDHVGFPGRYEGTLTWRGDTQPIRGLMSMEYARATSLTMLRDKPVPTAFKLPVNHFEWQVIKPADDTLLMFADASAFGKPMLTSAYVKHIDGGSGRHIDGVTHEILSYRPEPAIAPDGYATRIPAEFRWRIHDPDGTVRTEIVGVNDTDLIYGLGRGWIGGFSYHGRYEGDPVEGTAYLEYARLNDPGDD